MGLFIESPPNESEEAFHKYLDTLITTLWGKCLPESGVHAGKRIEYKGTYFREFHCKVSGVYFRIFYEATRREGLSRFFRTRKRPPFRAIIRTTGGDLPTCYETRDGREIPIDCSQIHAG